MENSLASEITLRKDYISKFLSEEGYAEEDNKIIAVRQSKDMKSLEGLTEIPYHRTIEEYALMTKIAQRLGMSIDVKQLSKDKRIDKKTYELKDAQGKHVLTLSSERRLLRNEKIKKFGILGPLEINISLEYPNPESITNLLELLVDTFYHRKPLIEKI